MAQDLRFDQLVEEMKRPAAAMNPSQVDHHAHDHHDEVDGITKESLVDH